jgi:hypothetical protein
MNMRVSSPYRAIAVQGVGLSLVVAALCLCLAPLCFADQPSSRTQHAAAVAAAKEESVLVATREAPPSGTTNDESPTPATDREALEPISQSSDFTPELATPSSREEESGSLGDNLTKAQPQKSAAAPTNPDAATDPVSDQPQPSPEPTATPSAGTARRAASARAQEVHFEPVKFQGAAVGTTSKH